MTFRKPLLAFLLVTVGASTPAAFAQPRSGPARDAVKGAPAASGSAAVPLGGASATTGGVSAGSGVASSPNGAPGSNGAAPSTGGSGVATVPAGGAGPVAAASGQPMDGPTYAVRLRDLEQRVDELKEQIRRSHAKLSLLSDSVLAGGVGGGHADIVFQNEMTSAFKLTRALVVLDSAVQYNKSDDGGALGDQPQIPIFSGSIPAGDHTVQVLLRFQGNGYGVFSYLKGYNFEVRSTHTFTATEGKTMAISVIAYEKGGVTTPLEERPAVRFFERVASGVQTAPAAPGFNVSVGAGAR